MTETTISLSFTVANENAWCFGGNATGWQLIDSGPIFFLPLFHAGLSRAWNIRDRNIFLPNGDVSSDSHNYPEIYLGKLLYLYNPKRELRVYMGVSKNKGTPKMDGL